MNLSELRARRCPFEDCPAANSGLRARVVRHATFKTRRGSRLRMLCKHCQRSFVATHATAYYRLRRSRSEFDAVIALLAEGVSQAAIARARGLSPSTVSRWISRAAEHSRAFEEAHLVVDEPTEVQLDELRSGGAGREQRTWVFNSLAVWSRTWLATRVGTRTLRNTLVFVRAVRQRIGRLTAPVLVTSDEFKYYLPCLQRTFGPTCVYMQVKNRYARGRITHTSARQLIGDPCKYEQALERSEDSQRPNTAYVERLNLHLRRTCAYLWPPHAVADAKATAPRRSARHQPPALQLRAAALHASLRRQAPHSRHAGRHHLAPAHAARDLPLAAPTLEIPAARQLVSAPSAEVDAVVNGHGGQPQLMQHAPLEICADGRTAVSYRSACCLGCGCSARLFVVEPIGAELADEGSCTD
ncbi:MAG: helix-turn-helix domain-containing protein [Planctomycetes bacterium]|nr:helix-turn-helix domain-containing protein [Planctomycetota bacterium]